MDEFDIIRTYFSGIQADDDSILQAIGDDAAVINVNNSEVLLVSTDTLIAGTHFDSTCDPFSLGYKSLAVNLSDMAAMAAQPRWVTLSISLPERCHNPNWLSRFSTGFSRLAEEYSVSLIGGDTTNGELSITVQIMGTAPKDKVIYRSGARTGDTIYLAAEIGTAAFVLQQLSLGAEISDQELLQELHQPKPQVQQGLSLRGLASAMIDISDGLYADITHILSASNVGAEVELEKIPVKPCVKNNVTTEVLWNSILSGGDDYKLCFTSNEQEQKLQAAVGELYPIGRITDGPGLVLITPDGTELVPENTGYRHFS